MKKFTLITIILITANLMFAQINKIDTSFYSQALGEEKMVDVYFPPGYDDNPNLCYPVIYYLHAWMGDQNAMGEMLSTVQALINSGTIDPLIMVSADNSPEPFEGSFFVNSELWGNYEDYMINDLINWIDTSFRTIPEKDGRALLGQSMGAYGAFRYGILHKDKFKAFAAHAGIVTFNKDLWLEAARQKVILENQPGPPYAYNYSTDGLFTKGTIIMSGAFSPNANTPQTYINPPVVDFLLDENADYIDSIFQKWQPFDLTQQIKQLSPADSVGIYFGCGTNDNFLLFPANQALNDTLDAMGLPHEFYSHTGNHNMPAGFKHGALIFIDSLLMPPFIPPNSCLPQGIQFSSQEEIDNFQANYPGCSEIEGDVQFWGSPYEPDTIKNLNGLSVLTSINGNLEILYCESLNSLQGLHNVQFVGGNFILVWNAFSNLDGLQSLTTIMGDFAVGEGEFLNNLMGLDNLTSIGGSVYFGYETMGGTACTHLLNLTGLENLSSIGGDIQFYCNILLEELSGLSGLTQIGGNLWVLGNQALQSLAGLENIEAGSIGHLSVAGNEMLSDCDVQSICAYLADPGGTIEIHDNAPGCNSPEEVEEACNGVAIEEFINSPPITISPNPFGNYAVIGFDLPYSAHVSIQIFNTMGAKVAELHHGQLPAGQQHIVWDSGNLPKGMYFCHMQIGDELITQKIIKY